MKQLNPKKRYFVIVCFLLFGILGLYAQQYSGKIKGIITTSEGEPAASVSVILNNSKYATTTNDEGYFEFNRVKAQDYILSVFMPGYEAEERQLLLQDKETISLNLQLKISQRELNEVVVSGQNSCLSKKTTYVSRMPLTNLKNPQVYHLIQKDLLDAQLVNDIKSALQNTVGVLSYNYPAGGVGVGLRGFITGVNARNGMETTALRSSLDLSNVERIEVLKGPSGTLFGATVSSFGGVVNLVTKKPSIIPAAEFSYTGGSYSLSRATCDLNHPLTKDKSVLFRLNMAMNKEHYFLNYGLNNSFIFAPSLSFKASGKLSFHVDAELYDAKANRRTYNTFKPNSGIRSPADLKLDYRTSLFHDDVQGKTSASKVFVQADFEISKNWKTSCLFSLVSENVAYSYQSYLNWDSPTKVEREVGLWGPISNNYSNIQQNVNGTFNSFGLKHTFLAGANYRYYEGSRSGGKAVVLDKVEVTKKPSAIRLKDFEDVMELTTMTIPIDKTFSVYACDVLELSDRLSTMIGLRLDSYKRLATEQLNKYDQLSISPKIGLVYQLIKARVSVFGNYMNGFQNVAPIERKAPLEGAAVLDPVYAAQYEAGIKAELLHKKCSFTASVYRISINNAIRADANGNPIQDGALLSKGYELELIANPMLGWELLAGFAYNDNRIVKATNTALSGNKATASPEKMLNFWSSYSLQNSLKGLGLGFGFNYVDESFFNAENTFFIPAYFICNASLFYEQAKWRVALKLNNITNKRYWDIGANSQAPTNFALNLTFRV